MGRSPIQASPFLGGASLFPGVFSASGSAGCQGEHGAGDGGGHFIGQHGRVLVSGQSVEEGTQAGCLRRGSPCASRAPMTPASTSPEPAVANREFPVELRVREFVPGSATRVPAPFQSTTHPVLLARAMARSSRLPWEARPKACSSRRASPSWGVRTIWRQRGGGGRREGVAERRFRPSASNTFGRGAARASPRKESTVGRESIPGPRISALARRISLRQPSREAWEKVPGADPDASGNRWTMRAMGTEARISAEAGTQTTTTPAPARSPESPTSKGAPE